MATQMIECILQMVADAGGIVYHTESVTTFIPVSDLVLANGEMAVVEGAKERFNASMSPTLRSAIRENRQALVDYFRSFREAENRIDDLLPSPGIGSFQTSRPPCPTREGALPCECHGRKLGFPFGYVYARDGLKVVARPAEAPQETAKTPATDQPRKLSAASEGCGGADDLSTDKGEN